jgi:hypothetical protein
VIEILNERPYLIFNIFILSANFLTYLFPKVYILIELQSFGGNIYFNMVLYEFCGILATFFALKLLNK